MMRMTRASSSTGLMKAIVASLAVLFVFGSAASNDDAGLSSPPPTAVSAAAVAVPVSMPEPPVPGPLPGRKVLRPVRMGEGCAGAEDIAIYQGHASSLPSGIPAYRVFVTNRCLGGEPDGDGGGGCAIAGIHVRCGWFSSASQVDPRKFRRLGHDDCLLNDGRPLLGGETLAFEYANSFPYDLSVHDATCVTSP